MNAIHHNYVSLASLKWLTVFLLFVAVKLSAQSTHSFQHNGINRNFIVYAPTNIPDTTSPALLLALHGFTQNGQTMMQYSAWNTLAESHKFIVTYPSGLNTSWNAGQSGGGSGADDVGFLMALADTLHAWYGTDNNRIYAAGFSNGGFMAFRLACEVPNRIAAIATVAGNMATALQANCQPSRAVPVLHIHGTSDFIVPYNGSSGFLSVEAGLQHWRNINQCPTEPEIVNLPDLVPEGSTVQQIRWFPCAEGTELQHLKVINGGHTWPGYNGFMGIGNANMDISASAEIWNFVSRFSLNAPVGLQQKPENSTFIYPNPVVGNILTLIAEAPLNCATIKVFDLHGKKLMESTQSAETVLTVDVSGLKSGTYFLQLCRCGIKDCFQIQRFTKL